MADRPPILRQAVSRRLALRGATALGAAILLPRAGWADEPHHDHMSATLGVVPRPVVPALGQPLVEPELARSISERIAALLATRQAELGNSAIPPALIVQPRLRRALAALLRLRAPGCPVLSIAELPESQPVEVIAVIGGDPPPAPALAAPDMSVSTRAHSTFEGLPA